MTARALGLPLHILNCADAPALPVPLQNVESILVHDAADAAAWLVNRIRGGIRLEYDYSILPGSSQIPFLPNPSFVGRNAELVDIYLDVIAGLNQLGRSFVGLTGLPGVGKTQFAVEFAYRFAWAFDRVLWLPAPTRWNGARSARAWVGYSVPQATPGSTTLRLSSDCRKRCRNRRGACCLWLTTWLTRRC
jgi:hypothetical protein